ncbi:MAG: SGNH/GDSL hydrolase family protein [Bacteroidetes bacterium]|nr:SGNH/GDSL hydrolase family protein [Bacteroidota bacterium]
MIKKKLTNLLISSFVTIILLTITLEATYRLQLFDFYKPELNGLNRSSELNSNKKKILVCGDSFTADPNSYVKLLKDSLQNYAVINAAVPGTGILQQTLYIKDRIHNYQPDIFIYQFYTGNDLFDITHPVSSNSLSLTRKCYWWLSDHLLSLAFLNYRFAGWRYQFYDDGGGSYKPKIKEEYSFENYSKREKLNYQADPQLIENTLFLKNGREHDFEIFKKEFLKIIELLGPDTKIFFIIIPHQSQLSLPYFERHSQLGSLSSVEYYNYTSAQTPLYSEILKMCNKQLTLIDPLEMYKREDTKQPVYYNNDPHLNSTGQSLLGQLLLKIINN